MMTSDQQEPLSRQGEARREAMLGELTGAMSRLHRGRRILRSVTSAAAIALIFDGVFRYADFGARESGMTLTTPVQVPSPTLPQPDAGTIVFVHTDSTIQERYRVSPPSIIVLMDDAQLLKTLVEVGRPAGLIRIGERLAFSTAVTDDDLRVQQESR